MRLIGVEIQRRATQASPMTRDRIEPQPPQSTPSPQLPSSPASSTTRNRDLLLGVMMGLRLGEVRGYSRLNAEASMQLVNQTFEVLQAAGGYQAENEFEAVRDIFEQNFEAFRGVLFELPPQVDNAEEE